ncbi:class C sortase [Arcanobacterium canis]|uniref:Class C sortase n=1 Tax=Arcanobacterium canis TaxID=999183 RepID=A0ABY8FYM9_9ACTO|nr:class C sortase [Arcanobacterium canis]WFM83631.1 class C sortase [Arcanobacterium canis]
MSTHIIAESQKVEGKQPVAETSVWGRIALPLILATISIVIMLYPVVVTQLKNLEQMRVSAEYSQQETAVNPQELSKEFTSAQKYNATRAQGPILDPWLARISKDNRDYQAYLSELNTFEVMGRLVIPAINVDLPVYHGTGEDSLQRGVGHLYGSDLPVGGQGTHSVLTSHSGLRNATLFDNLVNLKKGDSFYIGVAGQRLKYQVYETQVVLPNEIESLNQVKGKDLVTLITCTPYGINSHRLLVHAERVPMDETEEVAVFNEPSTLNWQWWMFALMAAALALALGMGVWARNQVRATRVHKSHSCETETPLFTGKNNS